MEAATINEYPLLSASKAVPPVTISKAVQKGSSPTRPNTFAVENYHRTLLSIPLMGCTSSASDLSRDIRTRQEVRCMFPRSLKRRIEETLLLKIAVRRLQDEYSLQSEQKFIQNRVVEEGSEDECSWASDWGRTLLAPLNPDIACVKHLQETTKINSVTFATSQEQQSSTRTPSPDFSTSSSKKSIGDRTVATETESIVICSPFESLTFSELDSEDEPDFLPVQIEWEDPLEMLSCPRILTPSMMQHLHDHGLPEILKGNRWERCFAIGRDGDSFVTFLDRCAPYRHTLLVIQSTQGHILGGFAAQTWRGSERFGKRSGSSYYGSGQAFLFCSNPASSPKAMGECPPLECQTTVGDELQLFKWTGKNDYCQICNIDEAMIAMGGEGNFGLILEDGFWRGQTGYCGTFANPPLVPGGFFQVAAFEVYGLVPLYWSFNSAASASLAQDIHSASA